MLRPCQRPAETGLSVRPLGNSRELFSKPAHYDLDLNTQQIPIITLSVVEEAAPDSSKQSRKALNSSETGLP